MMRPNVFENEQAVAAKARERFEKGAPTREEYGELLAAFEQLLRQSEKIVRIGDSTQNKLLRAQKMLHRAIQRYKSTAEQKSELLSIVTHDLKNKATPIRELTRWVIEDVQPVASQRALEMLRHIHEAADKMAQNLSETLNRESSRSSEIVPVFEWANIAKLAQRVVDELAPSARQKDITLDCHLPNSCDACVDEFLLGEVFENLINNAIKFSPEGSTVTVILKRDTDGVTFTVRDTGPGLSADDKKKIFGRFQKLTAKPTAGETSSGMGLFIVKKLVELHSGEVTADSEGPGKGSTFAVHLPPQADPVEKIPLV